MPDDDKRMNFEGLTPEWAVEVANHFDRIAGDRPPPLDDLWVETSLALVVRYRLADYWLGVRFGRLDVDPNSMLGPSRSGRLASNLYHSLHSPSEWEWTDEEGYIWWGDPPEGGWACVLNEDRLITLRGGARSTHG